MSEHLEAVIAGARDEDPFVMNILDKHETADIMRAALLALAASIRKGVPYEVSDIISRGTLEAFSTEEALARAIEAIAHEGAQTEAETLTERLGDNLTLSDDFPLHPKEHAALDYQDEGESHE